MIITENIAERFLKDNDSVDLQPFTSIDDAAAESLSKYKGVLWLDGLTELSDAAFETLSKHDGGLGLNGLTELSNAAIKSFLKKIPGDLSFEIKNYRRIAPTVVEDGEERPFYPNEGGEWTDEADFIFSSTNGLYINDDLLERFGTAEIHIAVVENEMGQFTYIDHKHDVDSIDDQFIKLFAKVAKPALVEEHYFTDGLKKGALPCEIELSSLCCDVSDEGDALMLPILKAYPEFIKKYARETPS